MRKPNSVEKFHTLWDSTMNAGYGLVDAVRSEKKVRQVVIAMAVAGGVSAASDVGFFEIVFVLFAWNLALICEIFNTALEKAVDFSCHSEFHPLIRQAKDYASACTFVSIVFAALLTLFILARRFF